MKSWLIVLGLLFLLAGTVSAQEDNIFLLYEHRAEGDNALGFNYCWGMPYAMVFLGHDYWEGYLGVVTPLPRDFLLTSAAAFCGKKIPVRVDALMSYLSLSGHEVELENYLIFPYQPVLSYKNPANINDVRWSWAPLSFRGLKFGPLLDGYLSLYNRENNLLAVGARLSYERKEAWGSWSCWLYLASGINEENKGAGTARFQLRLAI